MNSTVLYIHVRCLNHTYLSVPHVLLRPGKHISNGIDQAHVSFNKRNILTPVWHYLSGIVLLSVLIKLSKIIYHRSHAGRDVKHSIHQLAKRDPACIRHEQNNGIFTGRWWYIPLYVYTSIYVHLYYIKWAFQRSRLTVSQMWCNHRMHL